MLRERERAKGSKRGRRRKREREREGSESESGGVRKGGREREGERLILALVFITFNYFIDSMQFRRFSIVLFEILEI